jgi:hypothetical protein
LSRKLLRSLDRDGSFNFRNALALDLANALARHRELLADLLQRIVAVRPDADEIAEVRLRGLDYRRVGEIEQRAVRRGLEVLLWDLGRLRPECSDVRRHA